MLNKSLLRFSLHGQKICPRFLDPHNRTWQNLAEELANLYENGSNHSREELAELVQPILNTARSPVAAKGLNKLLLDRCTFQEVDSELETLRLQVFATVAQHLRPHLAPDNQGTPAADTNNLEKFRQVIAQAVGTDADSLSYRLYADLPNRQLLLAFEPIGPEQLLHRYNMAQAKSLLLWANSLHIELTEPDVGIRRRFFHHLKFCRLLARLSQKRSGEFSLQVDGPLSLFDNHRKYGLQLANFLPAVCALQRWQVRATIRMDEAPPATLELDQNSGLTTQLAYTSTYIPEDFERFAAQFAELQPANTTDPKHPQQGKWQIKGNTPLLEMGAQEWAVPDFSFRHDSGCVVHLELFHRWHASLLLSRLQSLQQRPKPLAIGVDRFLTKNTHTKEALQQSAWYQQHGLAFNEFPPVKRVIECLNSFLEIPPKPSPIVKV